MKHTIKWLMVTALFIVLSYGQSAAQTKDSPEAFYRGKTIKFIVAVAPGGTYDLWARALAPHLEKHTGAKIIVENIPGAGGLVGAAQLFSLTKPDGLTIGVQLMTGLVLAEMLELETARYDLEKFTYIGRIDVVWRAILASKASGFKSMTDMQKASKPIRWGATEKTSASAVDIAILSEVFGLKSKIIPGFKGSKEYMLATIAGRELDAVSASLAGYEEYVQKGDLVMIAVQGDKRFAAYPKVPTVSEHPVASPDGKKLLELLYILSESGRMILAPPGIPPERRRFLEKALLQSLQELALLDWARKNDLNPASLTADRSKALIDRLTEIVPKAERPRYKNILLEKYF
jgi:tripartite-type tricarboxylate transporter receptor subunit TctC